MLQLLGNTPAPFADLAEFITAGPHLLLQGHALTIEGARYALSQFITPMSPKIFHNNLLKMMENVYHRADFRFVPSQWETSLQSNAVSHWLGTNLESALYHKAAYI